MAPGLSCMASSSAVVGTQLQRTPRCLQAAAARQGRQRPAVTLAAVADRGSSGGAVLDRPGLDRTGLSTAPQTDSSGSQLGTSGGRGTGGGSWRILLLDSEHHTEERVVQAILAVVPGVEEPHAANCFHKARTLGQAIIVSVPREHAEHFCQQLWSRGCRVNLEPDSTVI